jgi:hypothetical protein
MKINAETEPGIYFLAATRDGRTHIGGTRGGRCLLLLELDLGLGGFGFLLPLLGSLLQCLLPRPDRSSDYLLVRFGRLLQRTDSPPT